MHQTLEERKAELETLFEEYKCALLRMLEILGQLPQVAAPLLNEYGPIGVEAGLAILRRFGQVNRDVEAGQKLAANFGQKLAANSNRAN